MPNIELPYVVDETLTGLSLAYLPQGYIADKILTPTPVDTTEFKYRYYEKGQFLTSEDTEIGEYGIPNEDEFVYKEKHLGVKAFAHETKLSLQHLTMSTSEKNKEAKRVMFSKNKLLLADEIRLAKMLRDKDIYEGNSLSLTASNNFAKAETKITNTIQTAKGKMFMPANTAIMSYSTLQALRTAPQIVKSAKGADVSDGMVSVEFIKNEVLDVENLLIGKAKASTGKRGQEVALDYVWGNDIILAYIDTSADLDCGVTFGQRAVYEDYNTQTYLDPKPGVKGVKYYKTCDQHVDFITCPDCGYIIKNCF